MPLWAHSQHSPSARAVLPIGVGQQGWFSDSLGEPPVFVAPLPFLLLLLLLIEILWHYHQAKSQSKRTVLLDAVLVLEVNEKVAVLFAEHPDLLAGFRAFLPDAAMVAQTDDARADERVLC